MLTFKSYLALTESRMGPLYVDSAISWMDAHSQAYLNGGTYFFRGVHTDKDGLFGGDSNAGRPRRSANSMNYYTLFMDNHPSFKEFPKRSRAFICTTDENYASDFGGLYMVVPDDRAKVGIVGKKDIWAIRLDEKGYIFLNDLNEITWSAFNTLDMDSNDNDYSSMKEAMKKVKWRDIIRNEREFKTLVKLMDDHDVEDLFELWEKLLKPSLFKYAHADSLSGVNGEVWIDGHCVFIPFSQHRISNQDQFELLEWAIQYPKFDAFLKKHWDDEVSADDRKDDNVDPDSLSDEDVLTSKRKQR